jgi:hypothetical protein
MDSWETSEFLSFIVITTLYKSRKNDVKEEEEPFG